MNKKHEAMVFPFTEFEVQPLVLHTFMYLNSIRTLNLEHEKESKAHTLVLLIPNIIKWFQKWT